MRIKPFTVGPFGTNCYLVWDESSGRALLIDPGEYEASIEKSISEIGLELKYIILTHGHFDHTGGVDAFITSSSGVVFAASEADGSLMDGLKPDIFLKENDTVEVGTLSFRVLETPGHTEGSLCFYIPEYDSSLTDQMFSGTVFSGDTLFHSSVGRTDLPGGNFNKLKESIQKKLFSLPDDTLVLPGHMDATTIGNEKKYNPFVR